MGKYIPIVAELHDISDLMTSQLKPHFPLQAKAYARANDIPSVKYEMDRSTVTACKYVHSYNNWENYYWYYNGECQQNSQSISKLIAPYNSGILILCIFLFSNLLLLSLIILYFRTVFLWLDRQGKQTKTLYKASAIVLTCVNIILLTSDIAFIISDSIHYDPVFSIVMLFIIPAKGTLAILILTLETPVVCYNTRGLNQNNGMIMNKKRYRIAHAFALCQIIWFMHRLVNDAIISIVFFIIAPAQTLGVVTLLLFVIASAIAFVAIVIYKDFKTITKSFIFCVAFNGIIACGLLFVVTLLFIVFVDNGLKSAGMGGLILSLVPPLAVFVIGFIVNQKYNKFKSTHSTASVDVTMELEGTNENTAIQLDDEGETDRSQILPLMRSRHPNRP